MSDLTFDQIIFKASHNSYDRNETLNEQLTFNSDEPYNCGCMGLELDIWRHTSDYKPFKSINENYFTVSHITPGNTPLSSYLQKILEWNNNNPNHSAVLITLDIKSTNGGNDHFHEEIDTYLKCYFNKDLIFKPHQLMKDESLSLCENVITYGWPALSSSDLKEKFIFCLSGNKDWKSKYAQNNITDRYCFSDQDKSDSDKEVCPPRSGNIVFFNFNIHDKDKGVWMNTIPPFSQKKLITRTYVSNSETNWNNCIKANVNAISTNKISNYKWCRVNNYQAYKEKNKYIDKRYLKNKANGEYRTNKATKMIDVYQAPECTFIFEKQDQEDVYAIRNAQNNEYFDCSITTMSKTVDNDCQRWKLIMVDKDKSEYFIQNIQNKKYLTKRASKLSSNADVDEIYIINSVE